MIREGIDGYSLGKIEPTAASFASRLSHDLIGAQRTDQRDTLGRTEGQVEAVHSALTNRASVRAARRNAVAQPAGPQIKRVELGQRDGGRPVVRYQLTVDVGVVDGKRKQLRRARDSRRTDRTRRRPGGLFRRRSRPRRHARWDRATTDGVAFNPKHVGHQGDSEAWEQQVTELATSVTAWTVYRAQTPNSSAGYFIMWRLLTLVWQPRP